MRHVGAIEKSCVGCGICAASCPKSCITMKYTALKEYRPQIDAARCIDCGICADYCMQSAENKAKERRQIESIPDPVVFGLEYAAFYIAKHRKNEEVIKSCSGGVATSVACRLLSERQIDCVIHAERVLARRGKEHYRARISRTADEVRSNRGSIYGPVCFAEVFSRFKGQEERILLIGTPCVISGAKRLFGEHPAFKKNNLLTMALMCSHSATGAYTDFIGDDLGISPHEQYYCNMRKKDRSIQDRHNFKISYQNDEKIIGEENRYACIWTETWRAYYFVPDACFACTDFYGRDADISLKDSWGRWGQRDPYGSTMIVVRNRNLDHLLANIPELTIRSLTLDDMRGCDADTVRFKLGAVLDNSSDKRQHMFRTARRSKILYRIGGYTAVLGMVLLERARKVTERMAKKWLKGNHS